MSKVTITTNDGVVIEEFCPEEDWGDIDKPLPTTEMVNDLRQAIKWAQEEEAKTDDF